jgi:hypoxanthine phosphoribosyltransferase
VSEGDFDTMVGTGLSGALVVPTLARATKKLFAIVRKDDDLLSHHETKVEGTIGERWIFVDDFVSSGATLRRVVQAIRRQVDGYNQRYGDATAGKHHIRYVGRYTYAGYPGPMYVPAKSDPVLGDTPYLAGL